MRPALIAIVVAITAAAVATVLLLPPAAAPAVAANFPLSWPTARGAFHVHSSRSDGTGTLDEIASAAARAGLQFVVITDHGNGTRAPEPPAYRSGVLCIDGAEISSDGGHYAALGLAKTPYPLAGDARDVVEDVRRFGGFGFAAHPGSPRPQLQWDDWNVPMDGIEWLNADSEWRDEFWGSLGAMLLTYPFRSAETLGALLDRPEDVLSRWDSLTPLRKVPAVAGADAHARLGFRQASDPYHDRVLARAPSYEVSFRAFVNHVVLSGPLTGRAEEDAALVMSALREGRSFTSIDSLAGVSIFEAKAESGLLLARPGEYLESPGPVAIHAQIAGPAGTRLSVIKNGERLYETTGQVLRVDVGREPGAYRVEAHLPSQTIRDIPWVLTNPMYVGLRSAHERAAQSSTPPAATERFAIETWLWRSEASAGSSSQLDVAAKLEDGTPAHEWRYALAPGEKAAQYAAIRFPRDVGLSGLTRLQLRARSDGTPKRIWTQLRAPGAGLGERWGKTFYIDTNLTPIDLAFADFRPIGEVSSPTPPLDRIDSLLLVVDTLNNEPGSTGRILFTDFWLAR